MSDLMEIREFIQRIAQGITFAIGTSPFLRTGASSSG